MPDVSRRPSRFLFPAVVGKIGTFPVLCLTALLTAATTVHAQGTLYDISYLRYPDRATVAAYEKKVAYVLGPGMAKRLRVVRVENDYGLIYPRHGRLNRALATMRVQSRLLTRRGLKAADIIPAGQWRAVKSGSVSAAVLRVRAITQHTTDKRGRDSAHSSLGVKVNALVKEMRRRGLISPDEKTAWSVYDFTTGTTLVSINEDESLETASLIKPYIALAYFDEVKSGRLRYGYEARRHMESMIQESDNSAADWFLRRMGGPAAVQRLLQRDFGGMFSGLHLVEYIPRSGHTYRNKASVHDYVQFLYALWNDELPGSAEIKRVMHLPKRDRLLTGAHGVPRGTPVYDKTGSTSRLCGDMGILVARGYDGRTYPYILVGVIQKDDHARHYGYWIRSRGNVIRRVSSLVYTNIAARHNLERRLSLVNN